MNINPFRLLVTGLHLTGFHVFLHVTLSNVVVLWTFYYVREWDHSGYVVVYMEVYYVREWDHSGYGLSQWEPTLHFNVVSHWLDPYLELTMLLSGILHSPTLFVKHTLLGVPYFLYNHNQNRWRYDTETLNAVFITCPYEGNPPETGALTFFLVHRLN